MSDSDSTRQRGKGKKPTYRRKNPNSNLANDSIIESGSEPRTEVKDVDNVNDDEELCVVCAEVIQYSAIYPCTHVICHVCAVRMRALLKTNNCALCRTEQDEIIITSGKDQNYSDFKPSDLTFKDVKLGIFYTSKQVRDDCQSMLKYNCPASDCHEILLGWKDLKTHVQSAHDRKLCDICTRHKKVFTKELELYTHSGLLKHERKGDGIGFTGHPQCEFCRTRFYSDDELFLHCREKHEKCFICDRENPSQPQYYKNYESLEIHFRDRHFVCNVQKCIDEKFVVYGTQVELQDHMLSKHPEIVGRSKSARRIEPTFGSSRDTGFQSQLSTISASTVINASNSNNNNTSNGHASRTTATTLSPPTMTFDTAEAFPELGSVRDSSSLSSASRVPASVTRYHANIPRDDDSFDVHKRRLEERARNYLRYDSTKFNNFTDINSRFKTNDITAKELIFEYTRLFSQSEVELLVQDLAVLNNNLPMKHKALNTALIDWKNKKSYPALGPSAVQNGNTSSKKSSAPVWGSTTSNSSSLNSKEAFPSLPKAKAQSAPITRTASPASSSTSLSALVNRLNNVHVSKPSSSIPSSSTKKISQNDFPSLPTSNVNQIPRVKPVAQLPSPSDWGKKFDEAEDQVEEESNGKGKRRGKKKQVLFHMGL